MKFSSRRLAVKLPNMCKRNLTIWSYKRFFSNPKIRFIRKKRTLLPRKSIYIDIYIYMHITFFNDAVAQIFSSRQGAFSLLQIKDIAMEICMISYNVD